MRLLGPLQDIPAGEGRTYAVDGEMIAVFRLRDGSVRAVGAVCPHLGGPLSDGQVDLTQVVCPLHAHAWDLRTGCSLSGQPAVGVFPVSVHDGQIVLGDAA